MTVRQLSGSAGLKRFVAAPWEILDPSRYPQWVPTLRLSVATTLDPGKNPFFRRSERALFVAEAGGRTLGRVAAIHNAGLADAGRDPGFFGFFECVDDPSVVADLLGAAGAWLKERGCTRITGPWNPTSNYDGGILIKGFEHPQTFFTPWNPEYYPSLVEGAGYAKAKDLLAWHVRVADLGSSAVERFAKVAEGVVEKGNLKFGPLDLSDFDRTMKRCWEVYTECWSENWGFSPLSVEEWLFIAHELKPLLIRPGTLMVQADGEIVGFALFVPDYNRAMTADRSGRLLPFNWLRLLRAKVRSPWYRTMLAGVLPEYRKKGLLSMMLYAAATKAGDYGVEHVEASWILEDNREMNLVLEKLNADPYRTWRIYTKEI